MITKETVKKIAGLAKLELTDAEVEPYAKQMSGIVAYFDELKQINTEGIEPLVTPSPIENRNRKDEVQEGLGAELSVKNAPEASGNLFKVPPVV